MNRILTIAVTAAVCASWLLLASCSKSSPKDPVDTYMDHMKTIFNLMKDNKDDCEKLASAVTAYTEKNRAEIEKSMSDEDKKKFEDQVQKRMEAILKERMAVLIDIAQRCPTQMDRIDKAMKVVETAK